MEIVSRLDMVFKLEMVLCLAFQVMNFVYFIVLTTVPAKAVEFSSIDLFFRFPAGTTGRCKTVKLVDQELF